MQRYDKNLIFRIKDYKSKIYMKMFLLLGVFYLISAFTSTRRLYFTIEWAKDGFWFLFLAIPAFLALKKPSVDFYNDKITQTDIFSLKHKHIVNLDEISSDDFFISPYNFCWVHSPWEIVEAQNEDEKNLIIGKNYLSMVLLFPFILLLRIIFAIKSTKLNFLIVHNVAIPLSELSQSEYKNLNDFLKEKFNISISEIQIINSKGEIIS